METRQIKTMGSGRVNLILHGLMATEMKGDTWTVCIPLKGADPHHEVHAVRFGNPKSGMGVIDLDSATDYQLLLDVANDRPDPVIDDEFLFLKGSMLTRQPDRMWAQIQVPKPDRVRGSRAVEMNQQRAVDQQSATPAAISRPLVVLSDTIVFSYFGELGGGVFQGGKLKPLRMSDVNGNLCVYAEPPLPQELGHHDHTVLLNNMFQTQDGKPLALALRTMERIDGASAWPSAGIDVPEMLTLVELAVGEDANTQKSGDPGGCGQVLIEF